MNLKTLGTLSFIMATTATAKIVKRAFFILSDITQGPLLHLKTYAYNLDEQFQ